MKSFIAVLTLALVATAVSAFGKGKGGMGDFKLQCKGQDITISEDMKKFKKECATEVFGDLKEMKEKHIKAKAEEEETGEKKQWTKEQREAMKAKKTQYSICQGKKMGVINNGAIVQDKLNKLVVDALGKEAGKEVSDILNKCTDAAGIGKDGVTIESAADGIKTCAMGDVMKACGFDMSQFKGKGKGKKGGKGKKEE